MNKYKRISVNGKKCQEHRVAMENSLGRKLSRNELVHHKNGIKNDNRFCNLQIVTHKEHLALHRTQLNHPCSENTKFILSEKFKHEGHPQAKLTWEIVDQIRARYNAGETIRSIGKHFNISHVIVCQVATFKRWVRV